jgi:hypothetical protein
MSMASASRPPPSTRQPLARRHPRLALPPSSASPACRLDSAAQALAPPPCSPAGHRLRPAQYSVLVLGWAAGAYARPLSSSGRQIHATNRRGRRAAGEDARDRVARTGMRGDCRLRVCAPISDTRTTRVQRGHILQAQTCAAGQPRPVRAGNLSPAAIDPRLALPRPQVRRAVSIPLRTPLLRLHVARLAIDLDRLSTQLGARLGGRCVCVTAVLFGTADPRYPQRTHIVLARRVPRPGRRAVTRPLVPLHATVCRPAIRGGSCACS